MFFRFFLYAFFLKSLNFRSVDILSTQLHCHMNYFIYWRYKNSTHLPYSGFARNFEFSSLVICILRSTKSQNFTILLFSNFTQQKSVCVCVCVCMCVCVCGGPWPPWLPRICRPCYLLFLESYLLQQLHFQKSYFFTTNHFRRVTISQLHFSPQLHFLLNSHQLSEVGTSYVQFNCGSSFVCIYYCSKSYHRQSLFNQLVMQSTAELPLCTEPTFGVSYFFSVSTF